MSESQSNANKKHAAKMKKLGFVRASPFIPKRYRQEFLYFAAQLRRRYLRILKKREKENEKKKTN